MKMIKRIKALKHFKHRFYAFCVLNQPSLRENSLKRGTVSDTGKTVFPEDFSVQNPVSAR